VSQGIDGIEARGLQRQIAVVDAHHGIVDDHIIDDTRCVAYLDNFTDKTPVTLGVDLKLNRLLNPEVADIGFRHIRDDLHLR
jgi:hypothetical protein